MPIGSLRSPDQAVWTFSSDAPNVRRAYGIDEIALVPGGAPLTQKLRIPPTLGGVTREIPIIASAMDGVVDVDMAAVLDLGALGVLNLKVFRPDTRIPTQYWIALRLWARTSSSPGCKRSTASLFRRA